MSGKRKHSELQQDGIHASRQALVETTDSQPAKRRMHASTQMHHRPDLSATKSVNAIKTRIRDITRRLERFVDLPADVRAEDERALAGYRQDLLVAIEDKFKQKMIKRYHMVRFFERQKATRAVKRLKKQLIEATDLAEVERLKTELHVADVDLNYIQYSPLNEPYVSLYPQNTPLEKKPDMWFEVERRMEGGGLDQLRNGLSPHIAEQAKAHIAKVYSKQLQHRPKPKPAPAEAPVADIKPKLPKGMTEDTFFKLNRREKRKVLKRVGSLRAPSAPAGGGPTDLANDGNGSDGGFFEE